MLEFNCYINGKKLKSIRCKQVGSYHLTHKDTFEIIREHANEDFIFIDASTKKDVTVTFLLKILKNNQTEEKDIKFLNRIIRNGGFTNYIKKLR